MQRLEKLKLNRDFKRLYAKGRSFVSGSTVLYIIPTKRKSVRLGITVGKKIGCAVKRNRAKRVITAAVRQCLPNICGGCDMVIVARTRILTMKSTQVAEKLKQQLISAGYWCENESYKQTVDQNN